MEKEIIKEEIKVLLSLKNNYTAITIVLTGGIAGLILSELNIIKIVLLIAGFCLDFAFISNNYKAMKRINTLLGVMRNGK